MNKLRMHVFVAGSALSLLAGCGLYGFEPSRTVTVSVASADADYAAESCDVLTWRLRQYAPHLNSTVTCTAHGTNLDVTLGHGAPPDETIDYLSKTQGRVSIYLYQHPDQAWITDADIVDAASAIDSNGNRSLNVRVSADAGQRLLKLTTLHAGQILEWSLDGSVMVRATIQGPFATNFQLTTPDGSHNQLLATVLKSGRLPASVVSTKL